MKTRRIRGGLVLTTLLVAPAPLLMLGCGGNSTAPATAAQTVTNPAPAVIISGATSAPATGPVTLTFTFSEPVAAFPVSAVTVTGATAAASTTMVNANQYSLVVTPPANASGSITVTVAAGAFTDSAGMASTAAASITQAYNTVVKALAYTVLDFNATLASGQAYNYNDFNGDATTLVSTGYPATGLPAGTGPQVAQIAAPAVTGGSAVYNGTFLGIGYENSVGSLPFFASSTATAPQATKMSVVFYSPVAGVDIKLKLQNASNSTQSVETDATAVQGWQTLVFDFASPAANTAALNPAYTYNTAIIFPNFGAASAPAGTYFVGPVTFIGASAPLAPALAAPGSNSYAILNFNTTLPSGETYNYNDFNGDATTLVSTGYPTTGLPTGTGPQVAQIVTPAVSGSAVYNGSFLGLGYENSVGALPFFASATAPTPQATKISVVLYSPAAGVDIKLKLQNASNASQSVETDVTAAQGWQTLVFDFANPAANTAALNAAATYNNVIIFPNFGATTAAAATYYVGPITFLGETAPLSAPLVNPNLAQPTAAAPTPSLASSKVIALYDSSNTYTVTSAPSAWSASWGSVTYSTFAISATDTVLKYAGLNYAGVQLASNLDVSTMTTMHVDVWTPNATQFGIQLVSFSGGATTLTGAGQVAFTSSTLTKNGWVSLEIPLSSFTAAANIVGGTAAGMDLKAIGQILWLDNMNGLTEAGTFYIDNVYFHD